MFTWLGKGHVLVGQATTRAAWLGKDRVLVGQATTRAAWLSKGHVLVEQATSSDTAIDIEKIVSLVK